MTYREENRWTYEAIGNQQEKRGDWNNYYIRAKSIYCYLHYDTYWLYLMNAVKKVASQATKLCRHQASG